MADRIEFDFGSNRSASSSKTRRSYSQRNVSSLQQELTKNRKMIAVKPSSNITINRTLSFKPLPVTNSTLANVENTPVKKLLSTEKPRDSSEAIEETPIKDDTDLSTSDMMAREIQRLSLRLRSSNPLYNVPVVDNQSSKPTALHLSQVVNRVSRCNYVLRRFVREAQKYHSQTDEIRSASQPVVSLSQSSDKGRRRLFIDSPKTKPLDPQLTPRKASGVIKQLFASPSASLKRSLPSPNHSSTTNDKRRRLF